MTFRPIIAALSGIALASCTGPSEGGRVRVQVAGSTPVAAGIAADQFADGWQATFEKVLVVFTQVSLAGPSPGSLQEPVSLLVDVTQTGVHELVVLQSPQARWEQVGFVIGPASEATQSRNASNDDLMLMKAGTYSFYVAGVVEKGAVHKRFEWGFTSTSTYDNCRATLIVQGDTTVSTQVNIEGEEVFRSSLIDDNAALRAEELVGAESPDLDDVISTGELAVVSGPAFHVLSNLDNGGREDVDNLLKFVEQLAARMAKLGTSGGCSVGVNSKLLVDGGV